MVRWATIILLLGTSVFAMEKKSIDVEVEDSKSERTLNKSDTPEVTIPLYGEEDTEPIARVMTSTELLDYLQFERSGGKDYIEDVQKLLDILPDEFFNTIVNKNHGVPSAVQVKTPAELNSERTTLLCELLAYCQSDEYLRTKQPEDVAELRLEIASILRAKQQAMFDKDELQLKVDRAAPTLKKYKIITAVTASIAIACFIVATYFALQKVLEHRNIEKDNNDKEGVIIT